MKTQTPAHPWRDRFGAALRDQRLVMAVEVMLIILLVVLRVQSKTILLLLLGWLSLWLRQTRWKNIGMRPPASWWRTLWAGMGISVIYQGFSIGVLVPILHRLTNTTLDLSLFDSLRGNAANLALWLVVSWSLAAFGEEMAYRGYIFNRLADLFGRSQFGWGIGIIVSSAFFGLSHIYQGPVGVVETFVFGTVIACLYLASKRNLWLPIIFHGMNDTIGFLLIFLGLYP